MRTATILLLLLTASATANASVLGVSLPSAGGVISGLTSIVSYIVGGFINSLSLAGDGIVNGRFIDNLKLDIHNKIQAGGQVTETVLRGLTANTLELAIGNKIIQSTVAARISLTYKLGNPAAAKPLTKEDIDSLAVGGDVDAADQFRWDLNVILQAQEAEDPAIKILAGLLHSVLDLLTGNAIIQVKGALDLKSYFNLPILVKGFKGALGSHLNTIIQEAVQSSHSFISYLKEGLQSTVDAAAHAYVARIINKILYAANNADVLGGGTVSRLQETFAAHHSSSKALTVADVDTLAVTGKPEPATKFRTTLKSLLQLKTDGYAQVALLSGLGSAVLDLLAENNAIKSQSLLAVAQNLILSAIVDLLNDASRLTAQLQAELAGDKDVASRFVTRMKPFLQAKVAESGKLTTDVLSKVISTVLNLVIGNKIMDLEPAARVSASFGNYIGLDIDPLQVGDVDALVIKGDEKGAAKFRDAMKALLKIADKGGPSLTKLAAVTNAVLQLAVANGVIGSGAATSFTAYFTA